MSRCPRADSGEVSAPAEVERRAVGFGTSAPTSLAVLTLCRSDFLLTGSWISLLCVIEENRGDRIEQVEEPGSGTT